jgi:hypothetical protein
LLAARTPTPAVLANAAEIAVAEPRGRRIHDPG